MKIVCFIPCPSRAPIFLSINSLVKYGVLHRKLVPSFGTLGPYKSICNYYLLENPIIQGNCCKRKAFPKRRCLLL